MRKKKKTVFTNFRIRVDDALAQLSAGRLQPSVEFDRLGSLSAMIVGGPELQIGTPTYTVKLHGRHSQKLL